MANEQIKIEKLKSRLKDIFCAENKQNKRYSSVWIEPEDFGGLYDSKKYILNVKAEHEIDSCNEEIRFIVTELLEKLSPEEKPYIWRVIVFNSSDEEHCMSMTDLVYTEEDACEN